MADGAQVAEELQRIVCDFLTERGFTDLATAVRKEGQMDPLPALIAQLRKSVSQVNSSGAGGGGGGGDAQNGGGPAVLYHGLGRRLSHEASFAALRDWVHASLDMFRPELTALLYPLFVRLYLDLVRDRRGDQARAFLAAFRGEFEGPGEAAGELTELAGVTAPEHIEASAAARAHDTQPCEVWLSALGFELLVAFLQAEQLLPVLRALNGGGFRVRVAGRAPADGADGSGPPTAAAVRGDRRAINEQPAALLALAELKALHDEIRKAGAPAAEAAKGPGSKRPRDGAPEPAVAASRIPLPAWARHVEEEVVLDTLHRADVGADAPPSCCMVTYLNAGDSVNTVEFAPGGDAVASGHADSSITLCKLSALRQRQLADQAEESADDAGGPGLGKVLLGHSGPVYALSFSRDDRFLLSASQDGCARLWSASDHRDKEALHGACLVCYRGHGFPVWDAAFSPLGYYFATGSHDTTARVWTTDKLLPLRVMVGHIADVHCVRFHPNCNYLATGSADCSVRLWDVSTGTCVRLMCGHRSTVTALAMSPDGRSCVTGSADATVRLWDLGTGKEVACFRGHRGPVWTVAYSEESKGGSLVASGGSDCAVRLWDVDGPMTSKDRPTPSDGDRQPVCEYFTKDTPVLRTHFTRRNLLFAAGPLQLASAQAPAKAGAVRAGK